MCAYVCIKIKHFTFTLAEACPSSDAIKLKKMYPFIYLILHQMINKQNKQI